MFGYVIFLTIIWFILGGRSPLAILIGILLAFAVTTLIHAEVGKNPPISPLLKTYIFYPKAVLEAMSDTFQMLTKLSWKEKYTTKETSPENLLPEIITITFSPRSIVTEHEADRKLIIHRLIDGEKED